MEDISKYINIETYKRIKTAKPIGRKYWMMKFLRKLNEGRYEQDLIDIPRMGRILKKFELWELPNLWAECEQSKNFQSHFWWREKREPYRKIYKPKQIKLL
jgi:hypothetical protein